MDLNLSFVLDLMANCEDPDQTDPRASERYLFWNFWIVLIK